MTRVKARQWRWKRHRPTDGKGSAGMVSGCVTPGPCLLLSLALAHPCQQPWVLAEVPSAKRAACSIRTPGPPQSPDHWVTQLSSLHGLAHWDRAIQSLSINSVWAQQLHSLQLQVTAPQTPNAAMMDKRHHTLKSVSRSPDGPGVATVTHPALLKRDTRNSDTLC